MGGVGGGRKGGKVELYIVVYGLNPSTFGNPTDSNCPHDDSSHGTLMT